MKPLDYVLQRIRVRKAAALVQPGDAVLDIGCADGLMSRLCPSLSTYVGIDPDAPVEQSKAGVTFLRGHFPHDALVPGATFDVITALAVIEHIPLNAQPAFAEECARHLRPSGILLLTVPAPVVDKVISYLKILRILDGMHDEEHYGYDHSFTPRLFRSAGLTLESHTTFELGLNHFFIFRRADATTIS